jgi:3-dehydroquinate synthase
MLHYAILGGEEVYDEFERALAYSWERLSPTELSTLAWRVLAVKRTFVEEDEFDTNVRRHLNFGHTFAHGIEYASAGKIPHGTAVAYGVDLANCYAQARGVLGAATAGRIGRLIRTVVDGSELALVSAATLLEGMSKDKKRMRDELELVLLAGLGRPLRLSVPIDEHLRLFLEEYLASW